MLRQMLSCGSPLDERHSRPWPVGDTIPGLEQMVPNSTSGVSLMNDDSPGSFSHLDAEGKARMVDVLQLASLLNSLKRQNCAIYARTFSLATWLPLMHLLASGSPN